LTFGTLVLNEWDFTFGTAWMELHTPSLLIVVSK